MSDLSMTEKETLETFLEMKTGYVLNFSDKTFKEFIFKNVAIDIDEDKYNQMGSSKAKKLRIFWQLEANYTVGKVIMALLEHWKTRKLITYSKINQSEQALFDACYKISERLMQNSQKNQDANQIGIDVHFEQIQKNIIEQIKLAKFTIWIAVAWFTDKVLFEHLVAKKNQGVNIQLIIIDDEINKNSGLLYEKEFETHKIRKAGKYENMMHNKFCIIDLKTVLHGSYNWTRTAQHNNESIVIIPNNNENAEKFAEQFIKLKIQQT